MYSRTLYPTNPAWSALGPFSGAGTLLVASGINDARGLPGLAAQYDASNTASMLIDASSRVSLWADSSGNSAVNGLRLNVVAGNYASSPSAAPLNLTTRVCLVAQVALNDWTPATSQVLVAKFDSGTNQRSYLLSVESTGLLHFVSSTAGILSLPFDSTVAPAVSDFGTLWVAVDVTANASALFYTSTDGVNWTQLGAPVSTAALTGIFSGSSALTIGANLISGVSASVPSGNIYRAQVRTQFTGGTTVFDANFTAQPKLTSSFTESSTNAATVTINTTGDIGANIAGDRDLVQLTVAKQPVYLPWAGTNYGYLPGVAGSYFTSPDAGPLRITGNIDLRAQLSLASWTSPGATVLAIAKDQGGGANRSYAFGLNNTGRILIRVSADGTTTPSVVSTVAVPFSANTTNWIRATYTVATGTADFYTSSDGVNWTVLGTSVGGGVTAIFNSTIQLALGANSGGNEVSVHKIYRAQIYNGIAGTLAFDFNPAAYSSGTTLLDQSANAATITINAGATIVTRTCVYADGVDDFMKSAAFALTQPETVYFTGQQVNWISNRDVYDGNASDSMVLNELTSSPSVNLYAGTGNSPVNTAWLIQNGAVVTALFNGAASQLRVNRAAANTGNPGTASANGYTFAARGAGTPVGNVTASEIVLYAAAHDTTQQNKFITYAGEKWNISV